VAMFSVGTVGLGGLRPKAALTLPSRIVVPSVVIFDLISMICAMEISRRIYAGEFSDAAAYGGLALVAGLAFVVCGRGWGLYRFQCLLEAHSRLGKIAAAAVLGALTIVALLFLLKTGADYSRGSLLLFAFSSPFLVAGERLLIARGLSRAIDAEIVRGKRVVLVGDSAELKRFTSDEVFHFGLDEICRFELSLPTGQDELTAQDVQTVLQAVQFGRAQKAAEYALIMPWSRDATLKQIIELLRTSPRAIRLYPDHSTRALLLRKHESDFDPYLSVEVHPEPLSFTEQLAKRVFDIGVSIVALLLLFPVMAIAAILIKLDSPGPVIFRQTRWGFDDREFKIWKFRTMSVMEDGSEIAQAVRGDSRVTAVGRVLRRTSIDELPQLINVLRGEMSIVGPRPHAVAHDKQYGQEIGEYALRRHVKPGLTGLAQVLGLRGETKTSEQMKMRIQKDLLYINDWSFWLDIKIIIQTAFVIASHEAY
jgi:Undecaprenyl-phosphate glucose phosphotransferase